MNLRFLMFFVTLLFISNTSIASTGKMLCEYYDAGSSKFDVTAEIDLEKNALALVMKSGFSILFHEKSIINKTTGQRIEQFEGRDVSYSFVQFSLFAKEGKDKHVGQLYNADTVDLVNFKCSEAYSLPHQRFINIAIQDKQNN